MMVTAETTYLSTSTEKLMSKAYDYCRDNINRKTTPKYVKIQMKAFMKDYEGKNKKYIVSRKKEQQIERVLKVLRMPKGLRAGESLYDCSTGYQWLIYIASLCTVYRDNENKRRYENVLLEICRKNFKTYTVATIFIILMLTEPKFSKFYSVAPDGQLSKEVKEAVSETLKASPLVYENKGMARWKIINTSVTFKQLQNKLIPLNYSTQRMDGKLPNAFIADETGALPSSYPINAMRSGQLNILNKLGFVISTKYPTIDNPFEEEIEYAKQVLDGIKKDEKLFALLYEPDDTSDWMHDDLILKQANPAALESDEIWQDLLFKRSSAIAKVGERENFVTKHCNIIYQGLGTQTYVDTQQLKKCRVAKIDWTGRVVYVGMDLSQSGDNTSVAMVTEQDGTIYAKSFCFIPEDKIEEKTSTERVKYRELIKAGKCFACGDRVIDYSFVEDFIMGIESTFQVQIQALGYDRWNALSSVQKLMKNGINCIEIPQHSSVLHPPTKLLREKIESGKFAYESDELLEINFQNARCTEDTNKNLFVNKKKSNGKVDMVVSIINACCLLQKDDINEINAENVSMAL